jgi:2-keto-4-pentenoate hydratase/2-oxohepta-3-ene-1,7-dioic acid hydratase in catechol pathway
MKLVRFGPRGREKPGIVDADMNIRDASGVIEDLTPATIAAGGIARLKKTKPETLPKVRKGVRLGPPVGDVRHFIGIGLNYADHAAETGAQIPKEPFVFSKAPSCIVGPNDDVIVPRNSEKTDWEVELAFVIGRGGIYIDEADALNHVAGYMICNDVSERTFQYDRGGQFIKGKSSPGFGPIGPWLVTRDEIRDPQALELTLDIDGERIQSGNTRTMIFSVAKLIAHLSEFMMLEPGDIVTTGTPPGVGAGKKPPRFLKGGETLHLTVTGLGEQTQRVVRYEG